MLIMSKLGDLLDLSSCDGKSAEDSTNVSTRLHGDNAKLVLLVNPDEEGLFIVVENTSTIRPVAVETTGF